MPLPSGETDPNKLYIAVGMAIHAWENMELSLAALYGYFAGLGPDPHLLAQFGASNRRFVDRMAALKAAGDSFFIGAPNQEHEGELDAILRTASDLSIDRHRIAHGRITMWAESIVDLRPGQTIDLKMVMHYRWGAPFYAHTLLRTDPVGGNAASIDATRAHFESLHNRVVVFRSKLGPEPSPQSLALAPS